MKIYLCVCVYMNKPLILIKNLSKKECVTSLHHIGNFSAKISLERTTITTTIDYLRGNHDHTNLK